MRVSDAGGHITTMTYDWLSRKTAMSDSDHPSTYKYDARGRLREEKRWEYSGGAWRSYTTSYTYDGADRINTIVYPGGETVTNGYNGRGLPYSVHSNAVSNYLVSSTLYNGLGQLKELNYQNGFRTSFSYWGIDHGTASYGKLWEIQTTREGGCIEDLEHTWDAGGNLIQRYEVGGNDTETFTYDYLDRLTSASGNQSGYAYYDRYTYDGTGNLTSWGGNAYNNGFKPHAVSSIGATAYSYDNNGNLANRQGAVITWDAENKPVSIGNSAYWAGPMPPPTVEEAG